MSASAIAMNRFGLGARRGEAAPTDPKAWLLRQIDSFEPRPAVLATLPSTSEIARPYAALLDLQRAGRGNRGNRRQARQNAGSIEQIAERNEPADAMSALNGDDDTMTAGARDNDPLGQARRLARDDARGNYMRAVTARAQLALTGPTPFAERLVHFWSNHFAVSVEKLPIIGLAGPLEFDAIRPHLTGRFSDMLQAVERHPAMLLYLDQAASIGPFSRVGMMTGRGGKRRNAAGLNENLAREILELHTLGVRSGYDQADVTEFARALTGWTVSGLVDDRAAEQVQIGGEPGRFVFADALHEPGPRRVLGQTFAGQGEQQAASVLDMLAVHPATATHIATKLARHFAGDAPPATLVARLETSFRDTDGDLASLYRVLVEAPECWTPGLVKFRTPWEWTIGTMRALGETEIRPQALNQQFNQLGQQVWRPGSPAGFDDIADAWLGPDAIMRRVEAAERLAKGAGAALDARKLAADLHPGALGEATAQAIARAESPSQALALLLVAPESMRR